MISPHKALSIVLAHTRPLKSARAALAEASGRFLAEDIRADRDHPPADRSAMDGFAVRAADLRGIPCSLRPVGEVAAGSPAKAPVRPGTCAVIFTGANVPSGADTVVMHEQTSAGEGRVTFLHPVRRGQNIRRRGEEARKGDTLLSRGALLGPAEVGICAGVGKAFVRVRALPRTCVLCTGDEVKDPASRVRAYELRDSNGPALRAAVSEHGFPPPDTRILPDDESTLAREIKRAAERNDVILLTGGVSVGKYDYVPQAVRAAGGSVRFHGVSMKPGKPQLYATFGRNGHLFALPGNPVSVLTGFHELALPGLRRLAGAEEKLCRRTFKLPLAAGALSDGDRTLFKLARLVRTSEGLKAAPVASHGSADLVAAGGADGVIVVPRGTRGIPAGALVEFHPWRDMR